MEPITLENGSTVEFTGPSEDSYVGAGFDAQGDYQFDPLDEEGTPYEVVQQIGKGEEENAS